MSNSYTDNFSPKGKKYYFNNANEDFCYKTRNGVCSLDLPEEEVRLIPSEEYPGEDDVNYCRNIYKSIIEKGQKYPVFLCRNKCGHYTFDDGQHRMCIAGKKGLRLRAEISENDSNCYVCYRENKIKESISYVEDLVRSTLPQKTLFHKVLSIERKSNFQDSLEGWKKELDEFQLEKVRDYREL